MNGQTKIYQDKTQVDEKDLEAESDGSDDEELELVEGKKVAKKIKTTEAISVRVPNDFFKRHLTNVFKRNKRLVKLGCPLLIVFRSLHCYCIDFSNDLPDNLYKVNLRRSKGRVAVYR